MTTPTTKEQRMSIWDSLRKRFHITENITSRSQLEKIVRKESGLVKYQHAKGKTKSILGLIKKSDFWQRSKYEDKFYFTQHVKSWKEGEESVLKGLMRQGYKGRELVGEFNMRVKPNRTYMAVHVRASRLRK